MSKAETGLGFARARLTDTQIVSPIRGLVVTRNLEVGSTVVPGTPIFRVADTSLVWVQAMVDEREAGGLPLAPRPGCCSAPTRSRRCAALSPASPARRTA